MSFPDPEDRCNGVSTSFVAAMIWTILEKENEALSLARHDIVKRLICLFRYMALDERFYNLLPISWKDKRLKGIGIPTDFFEARDREFS
jgi:hypothetical protein